MSDDDTKPDIETPTKLKISKNVTVAFKLNGRNYPIWSRLMKVNIGGRGAYSHIRKEPPEPGSRGYDDWEEDDLVVFSWIVDNIEDDIIADFAHHQTSKALWDSLAVTFESKTDPYLIYDLEEKAITIKQGDMDLETYYRRINGLWINIDRSQKQPISCCDKGIDQFRVHSNSKRLFKFLAGLNPEYDNIRRDILKEESHPSVEVAYGWVKREASQRRINATTSSPPIIKANGGGADSSYGGNQQWARRPELPTQQERATTNDRNHLPAGNKPDRSKFFCDNCNKTGHTEAKCFHLIGYPDWWKEKKKARAQAKLAIGVDE